MAETRTLTYEALVGGNSESPIFCGHGHPVAEPQRRNAFGSVTRLAKFLRLLTACSLVHSTTSTKPSQ
jgi:hypothetical protein